MATVTKWLRQATSTGNNKGEMRGSLHYATLYPPQRTSAFTGDPGHRVAPVEMTSFQTGSAGSIQCLLAK